MIRATIPAVAIAALVVIVGRAAVAEETKCEGVIVRIDGEMVAVKDAVKENQQYQMKIEPATRISSGGKPVMSNDLKVGQRVKCVCEKKDGSMICTSMEIMRDTP